MFSKYSLTLLTLIVFAGCTSPFNDRIAKSNTALSLGSDKTKCLEIAPRQLDGYFNGTSNKEEISSMWNCIDSSLEMFSKYVHGKESDVYRPEELRSFLERYFLGNLKISDKFLIEAMKLKNAVVGGGVEKISLSELQKTRDIITILKDESVKLIQLHPIRPSRYNSENFLSLDNTSSELIHSSKRLAIIFNKFSTQYQLNDFSALLNELNLFLKQADIEIVEFKTILDLFAPIKIFKRFLNYGSSETIEKGDWEKILVTGTKWYVWYLKYQQLTDKAKVWIRGEGLSRFETIMTELKENVSESLLTWPQKQIPFEEFDHLIDAIGETRIHSWLVGNIKAETLKKSLRPVFRRFLGGNDTSVRGRLAAGLTIEAINRTWTEVDWFFYNQKIIDEIFKNLGSIDNDVTRTFDRNDLREAMNQLTPPSASNRKKYMDLFKIISEYLPFYDNSDSRIYFPSNKNAQNQISYFNLYKLNFYRMVSRFMIRGYAQDSVRAKEYTGLTQKEYAGEYDFDRPWITKHNGIYTDFYDIGVELQLFQYYPETWKRQSGVKRFVEANLFTYAADGSEILNLDELTQMFVILSSAKSMSSEIHNEFAAICPQHGVDVYNAPNIDSNCFLNSFFDTNKDRYMSYLSSMPKFIEFFSKLSAADQEVYTKLLDESVRGKRTENKNLYDTDDFDTFATMIHYVEAMFARYDTNFDGLISEAEIDEAFEVFIEPLGKVSGFTKKFSLKMLFRYLLYYGKAPDAETLSGMADYATWYVKGNVVNITADRMKILRILSELSKLQLN